MNQAKRHVVVLAISLLFMAPGCGDESMEDEPPVANPSYYTLGGSPACGTVLGSWDGTSAYSNGQNTGTGWSCAGTGAYGYQYQCVELVMRHFKQKWGVSWTVGYAKYTLDKAPSSSVETFKNGDAAHPPVPGDMLVWGDGTYGHVALITEVTASSVKVLEQNVKGGGTATFTYDGKTVGGRWGSWHPLGWAHAKANKSAPPKKKVACKFYKQNPSGLHKITAGSDLKVEIDFTNTGNFTWERDTSKGISNPAHVELWPCDKVGKPLTSDSPFYHSSWINRRRITALNPSIQKTVAPNQTARFVFTLRAPSSTGVKRFYVIPTLAGKAYKDDCFAGAHFYLDVQAKSCAGSSSQACGPCSGGTQTRSCSKGVWSGWSSCKGAGCTPKSTKACGTGGTQTCDTKCKWGTCLGSKCSGASSQACGPCKGGTQTRTCSNGVWSGWSSCKGAGCTPKSTKACTGGTQTCDTKCKWGTCVASGLTKGTAKVYRFIWNGTKGGKAKRDHFYQLISTTPSGYKIENNGKPVFLSSKTSQSGKLIKLWRLYMGGNCMDHYYTVDTKEKNTLVAQGWKLDNPDNIGYCSASQATGTTPLYQTYSANLCDHFYTVNKAERDLSITNGYSTSIRTICYLWSP